MESDQNIQTIEIRKKFPPDWEVPEFRVEFWNGNISDYCVIVPVINEGDRIRNFVRQLKMNKIDSLADIIIIDGGSTDKSLEHDFLRLNGIRGLLTKTAGGKLSAQLRCAYAFALTQGYEGIITIDGNDKDNPEAITRFIRALREGFDFIQASHFLPGGKATNTPKARDFAIRYIHAPILSWASGFKWTDTTQGFRGYSRKLLLDNKLQIFRHTFKDYELLAYMSYRSPRLGYSCKELATERRYPLGKIPTKISGIKGNFSIFKTLVKTCAGKFNPS